VIKLPTQDADPRDPSVQAKKYAYLLLEPFLTPEVMAYLNDQSPENFEAAKEVLTSPLFQTAFAESQEYVNGTKKLDPWQGFLPDASEFPPTPEEKPAAPAEPAPKRRGAPLGNNNALKHGFYARRLPASHLAGLEFTGTKSLEDEINVLRIFIRRVVDLGGETTDLMQATSMLRIITFATMGINRLVRTQITVADPVSHKNDALYAALNEFTEHPELFDE
jgi:hypothetical protein